MDISIVTISFSGYGRYLPMWLAFVSNMSPKPKEVIIVLGKNHGLVDRELLTLIYPEVQIYEYKKQATFGKLRNIGIGKATGEFIHFVSCDDRIEFDSIKTFKRAIKESPEADYICSQWYTIGLGEPKTIHHSPTPLELAQNVSKGEKGGFIIPHSPFKRKLWEQHPYKNSDLPNYDFLLHCVLNGATFTKADKPTTTYLRRSNSHARTTLKTIQSKANKQKRIMQRGVIEYYGIKPDNN